MKNHCFHQMFAEPWFVTYGQPIKYRVKCCYCGIEDYGYFETKIPKGHGSHAPKIFSKKIIVDNKGLCPGDTNED